MRHATVQFGKNTITKTADPELMRAEVEKTRRAFDIGRACGPFLVPEVLDYEEDGGVATFELIRGIRIFVSSIHRSALIAERVGRALTVIHRELYLPPGMVFPLPPQFDVAGTEVFSHGDFNGAGDLRRPWNAIQCRSSMVSRYRNPGGRCPGIPGAELDRPDVWWERT